MELFNSNGISYVAAALFTGLFSFLGVIYKKSDAAAKNADSVSNGFTDEVKESLSEILDKQEELNKAFRDHLQWHLENPPRKRF